MGLSLDEVYLLLKFDAGMTFTSGTTKGRVEGSIGLLEMRGFLEGQEPTKKGRDLLARLKYESDPEPINSVPGVCIGTALEAWVGNMHALLVNKMVELTGKKQKMIQGKYPFLCNAVDLTNKLRKVISKYGLKDWNALGEALLKHIERSHKANWQMVMLMEYYVLKNDTSKLATDLENVGEEDVEINEAATIGKSINPKDLF